MAFKDTFSSLVRLALGDGESQKAPAKTAVRRDGYTPRLIPRTISRTRADISTWQSALKAADNVDNPKRVKLVQLQNDVMTDALLASQVDLRRNSLLATPFSLRRDGEVVQETELLKTPWMTELIGHSFDSILYGHTLIEITTPQNGEIHVGLIPRTNVVPEKGLLLYDQNNTAGVRYRDTHEFGVWLLEFGGQHDYGLLNKAIPHVLFKRFAQSCWSELCEIYGIPPRYLKTNTQDPEMLARAETMMRDMGTAAWFVIDESEVFEFAQSANTNGDVYRNLINLCNTEISMLISGAVLGQNTVNGNRSKEESSMRLRDNLTAADRVMVENYCNSVIIPALVQIGYLPKGLTFTYDKEEDPEKLWKMVTEVLPYKDVPNDYLKSKFGIDVVDKPILGLGSVTDMSAGFFD